MKKQIAVLMAAATAVTTVAPAIANADVNNHKDVSVNEAVEKARKALNDKYDNSKANGITIPTGSSLAKNYLNSKYIVLVGVETLSGSDQGFKEYANSEYASLKDYTADVKDNVVIKDGKVETADGETTRTWYVVDNATKLGTLLEANDDAVVSIIDKGSKDGSSVRTTTKKHYVSETFKKGDKYEVRDQEVSLYDTAEELKGLAIPAGTDGSTFVKEVKLNGSDNLKLVSDKHQLDIEMPSVVNKIELTLASDKVFTLEVNDDALDLKEALDKDGNTIKTDDVKNDQTVLDKIVDFKLIANKDDLSVDLDINNGDTEVYTVDSKSIEESLELNNIYTREDGYTSEGKDFVNGLIKARNEAPHTFNFRGTTYKVNKVNNEEVKKHMKDAFENSNIDKSGDGYKLTFSLDVLDDNDTAVKKTLKFVVKGDKQRDLYDVRRDLIANSEVVSGHFTKLAGSNRYATAVEVSAEQFGAEDADSVVIVGGKAQLDGLAAAPLASAKNAPILLADPNTGLNRDTIKEIDRACKSLKNKTVYIVGGEKSVPAKVAKQLEDEFGAVVQRVAGANRRATSLEVAKRLSRDEQALTKLFVVGGEGAADAMSVSSVASITEKKDDKDAVAPILVVDAKGMDRETREYIQSNLKSDTAYLIGGEKSLNTQVLRDLKTAGIKAPNRISGDNRYDTNVEVIKEFYSNKEVEGKEIANGAIFASGENAYLVDAQTSGAFAAYKDNRFPIVLAGNKLTNDQIDLMKDGGILDGLRSNIYQVGGVVSSDVMKVVVDKLDL